MRQRTVQKANRLERRAISSIVKKSKTKKVSLRKWNESYSIEKSQGKYKGTKYRLVKRVAIPANLIDAESNIDSQVRLRHEDEGQEILDEALATPDGIDYSTHPIVVTMVKLPNGKIRYKIFDGHHRLSAYQVNNYSEVVVDIIEEEKGCTLKNEKALKHLLNDHNHSVSNQKEDWKKSIQDIIKTEWSGNFKNIKKTSIEKIYDSFFKDHIIPLNIKPPTPSVRAKIIDGLVAHFAKYSDDITLSSSGFFNHFDHKSWRKKGSTAYVLSGLHKDFKKAKAPYHGTAQTTHPDCTIYNQGHIISTPRSIQDAFFNGLRAHRKNYLAIESEYPTLLTVMLTGNDIIDKKSAKKAGEQILKSIEEYINFEVELQFSAWGDILTDSQLKQYKRKLKKLFRYGWRMPHFNGEKGLIDIKTGKLFSFPKSWIKPKRVFIEQLEADENE